MPNAFDHRIFAGDGWGDMGGALAAGLLAATNTNGLDAAFPTGCTYAYGAGAGSAPTAFTTQAQFSAGSNAFRGTVLWNTGTTPTTGLILTVTFPVAIAIANLNVAPYIFTQPASSPTTAGLGGPLGTSSAATSMVATPVMSSANCTGFTLRSSVAMLAATGTATAAGWALNYLVLG